MRQLPHELITRILELGSQQDLINASLVCKEFREITNQILYDTVIITDAPPVRGVFNRFSRYGSLILLRSKDEKKRLVQFMNTLRQNSQLYGLIHRLICDIETVTSELKDLLYMISRYSQNVRRLEFPQKWFRFISWNINSLFNFNSTLQNILLPSMNSLHNLDEFENLKEIKILDTKIASSLYVYKNSDPDLFLKSLNLPNLKVFQRCDSLAIEDTVFAKNLNQYCLVNSETLSNIKTLTYKIDCLSLPQSEKFEFSLISSIVKFENLKNFKLVLWYTQQIEPFAVKFVQDIMCNLVEIENLELKRRMLTYTFEAPSFMEQVTFTNHNYMKAFSSCKLSNLKVLQFSGNYLNKDFILNSREYVGNKAEQIDKFSENFVEIFKSCRQLKTLIIDEFITVENSSKFMKFLKYSCAESSRAAEIWQELEVIASYGYSTFLIDAFDEDFDENVDCSEYDLIRYCMENLKTNYLKFSSLDDPSRHFFTSIGSQGRSVNKLNYIKSFEGKINFHKEFFHKQKSWKFSESCGCSKNDYKMVIELLVLTMGDYIKEILRNLDHLELLVVNGLFFSVSGGEYKLLFD